MKTFSGRKPSQRADELAEFIGLLREKGCRSYLEIGARHGDTFHAVMSALPAGSFGVAVDLPGGAWGTESSEATLRRAVLDLKDRGYRAHVVIGDSGSLETLDDVLAILGDRLPFDACMIDGDHRYEAVLGDYNTWSPLARLVALHDIDGEGQRQKSSGLPVEVPRAWATIRQFAPWWCEIIGAERGMGIGVVGDWA